MATYPKLSLPDSSQRGLQILLSLQPEQVDKLEQALQTTSPALWPMEFATSVASKVSTGSDTGHLEDVVRMLIGLYVARASRTGISITEFVERVCEAMIETGAEKLEPPDGNWTSFKRNLSRLLGVEQSLGITSKAIDVMMQHQHAFCTARVITDLRPVFKSDPGETPEAAVIVHMLKIAYHEGDQLKEFFVALDNSDLRELGELVSRAERKADSLRSLMKSANLTHLDPEGH